MRGFVRTIVVASVVMAAVASVPTRAEAQADAVSVSPVVRLNTDMPTGGVVFAYRVSADSQWVVYAAEQRFDTIVELFSVPTGGGVPTRLSIDLPAGSTLDANSFRITPDSARVVYRVFNGSPSVLSGELYSVPVGGGASQRLDGSSGPASSVGEFAIAPNSQRVVYTQLVQGVIPDPATVQLHTVPVTGGTIVPIGPATTFELSLRGRFTPDSQRVLVVGEYTPDNLRELWSFPATGGSGVRLSPDLVPGGGVSVVVVAPNSSIAVYLADQLADDVFEIFSVAPTGGPSDRLNGALAPGGDVSSFAISSDSTTVVYNADQDLDDTSEVYSVPVSGGLETQLNADPVPGGDVFYGSIAPDSSRVVYVGDELVDGRVEVFSAPLAGGTRVRLNPDLPAGGQVFGPSITNDSSRVMYLADQNTNDLGEMFVVPIAGGPSVRLNGDLGAGEGVTPFVSTLAPNSSFALVGVGQAPFAILPAVLYAAPISGGVNQRITPPLVAGGMLRTATITPDSSHVVYHADQNVDGVDELFSVAVSSSTAPPPPPPPSPPVLPDGASAFTPLTPFRVFESREGEPGPGPKGVIGAGGSVDVQVGGVGDVPANAAAVVLNVTATGSLAPGFVTVWPTGSDRPLASSLNLTAANQTRPNMVIVPLGAGGKVSMFSQAGTHLVADVTGYFTETSSAVSAGRLVPLPPDRVFDTRPSEPSPGPKGLVGAGSTIEVQVGGVAGVPSGAAAVVLNVTATDATAAGFITVWPTGRAQPLASTLNLTRPGDTTPNLVIVPLGVGGRVSLFSQAGANLLADVTGYVTSTGDVSDTSGLFVPLPPGRVFDTRPEEVAAGPKGFVAAGSTIDVQVGGVAQVPSTAGLVALNVTATQAATGFVTVFPGPALPASSTLNLNGPGDTRPNATLISVNGSGQVRMFSQAGTHLLADASGYTLP